VKKIVFLKKSGYLCLDSRRRGVFIYHDKGEFKSERGPMIPYEWISMIQVLKRKATLKHPNPSPMAKRREVSRHDVERYGGKVMNFAQIPPELIPEVIQAMKLAYKEATGVTDVEVEQELASLKEEDLIGDMIKKAGGVS
jgi:hypothetical protein